MPYYLFREKWGTERKRSKRVKEIKDCQIKVRLTKREKEQLQEYCAANELNISQCVRYALMELLRREYNYE